MEVDGKEFLRNVALEQDKERLIKEQEKLESLKRESIIRDETYKNMAQQIPPQEDSSAYVDLSINTNPSAPNNEPPTENVQDLMLEPEDPNKTKKKYIVLGMGLIVVFIITILVIRLISNNDTKEKMENINPETKELATDKILDKIDTNEEYQKVIDKKAALEEAQKIDQANKSKLKEIAIPNQEITNTPLVIPKPKPKEQPKRDLFGLDKNQQQVLVKKPKEQPAKPVVQKPKLEIEMPPVARQKPPVPKIVAPKVVKSKPTPPKVTKTQSAKKVASKIDGYFIQIGAFTKQPSKGLLNTISKKGYAYKVHPMTIKGKLYNKVLVGPYPTRAIALKDLPKVRKDLNNPSAYILKF